MATRFTKEQQGKLGFNDPRKFSKALTNLQNEGIFNDPSQVNDPGGADQSAVDETVNTPTSPTPIGRAQPQASAQDLGGDNVQTPEGGDDQSLEDMTLTELRDTIQSVQASEDEEVEQAEQQLSQQEQNLLGLAQDVADKPEDRARLEQEAGISDLNQKVSEINKQIELKSSQLTQELEEIGQQGFRATAVRGQAARARRQTAAEIEGLKAVQEAAKNNITIAQNRVDRAIKRKYGDIENRILIAGQALKINQSQFTRAEKKAAREREAELIAVRNELQQRQTQEATALSTINQAAQKGVIDASDAASLSEKVINGTVSPQEATAVASSRLGEVAQQDRQLTIAKQRAQIQSAYEDIKMSRAKRKAVKQKRAKTRQEKQVEQRQETEAALSNLDVIKNIYNKSIDGEVELHPGFSSAVGFGIGKTVSQIFTLGSADPQSAIAGTPKADFIASHNQLKDTLTLDNLELMSGVLSESDIKILSSAASRLDLSLSEDEYLKELDSIYSTFQRTIQNNGITPEQAQFYYGISPEDLQDVNNIFGTEEQQDEDESVEDIFNPANFY